MTDQPDMFGGASVGLRDLLQANAPQFRDDFPAWLEENGHVWDRFARSCAVVPADATRRGRVFRDTHPTKIGEASMSSILMFVSEEVLNDPPVLAEAMKKKFADGYSVVAVQLLPPMGALWHEDDALIPIGGHPSEPSL